MKSCLQNKHTYKTKELVTLYVELFLPFPDSTHPSLFYIRYLFSNLLLKALPSNSAKQTMSLRHIQSYCCSLLCFRDIERV